MNGPLLASNHPSAQSSQSWFLFALGDPLGNLVGKLFLVEARNREAVQVIEYMVASGAVSPTLLTVHRQCEYIGIRHSLVEEVSYVDFLIDMTDTDVLGSDPVLSVFQSSLTAEQAQYAAAKIDAAVSSTRKSPIKVAKATPVIPKPVKVEVPDDRLTRDRIAGALTGLGFPTKSVNSFIESVGTRLNRDKFDDLIREGILVLSAKR